MGRHIVEFDVAPCGHHACETDFNIYIKPCQSQQLNLDTTGGWYIVVFMNEIVNECTAQGNLYNCYIHVLMLLQ